MLLFIMLSVQGDSNFWVCRWMKSLSVTIQMKATEQYVSVVLLIMMYEVVLTLYSAGEPKLLLNSIFLLCLLVK